MTRKLIYYEKKVPLKIIRQILIVIFLITLVIFSCSHQSQKIYITKDGVRLWLNDKLIHHHSVTRHASPNEDIVAVNFNKGWNKVLVKIDQIGLRWGLFFSVNDPARKLTFSSKH